MEQVEFCTREEIAVILQTAKNIKHKTQILLLGDAGLRVSEMRVLKWKCFDFRNRVLTVKSLKKRGSEKSRAIPISDRLYDSLVELMEKHKPESKDDFLFPSPSDKTKPIGRSAVNNMFGKIKEERPEVGRIYPHKLRHTFATNLRAADADLADVKDLLGHESLSTTLIYAHADTSKLRAKINASKPALTWKQKLRNKIFGVQRKHVNWLNFDTSQLVGREIEARKITDLINKNISVVVVGKTGIGKSELVNSLRFDRKVLEVEDCKEFKKALANILLYLFNGDKESVLQLFYPDTDPAKLSVQLNKESVPAICRLLMQLTKPHEYILKIGDIENITPSVVKALEILKDHFVILTTARVVKMQSAGFIWNFERVELENLSRANSLRLTHYLIQDLEPEDSEYTRNKVWDISEGNPRMIQELCGRFRKEPILDKETVSDICSNYIGKQTQEIDMSIYLFIIFGALTLLRYLGRETHNPSLRFIGGVAMIVLMFGRYFFNSAKRKSI